jgi:uncharacterized membrane protein YfcA
MDATLAILLVAVFLGSIVSGLAGFAMGIIVMSVWLHFLPPVVCAPVVVAFGLITQGYGVWKLRRAFSWKKVAPFVGGTLIGVPLGAWLLAKSNPAYMRMGIASLVIVYSVYSLARPALKVRAGTPADAAIGAVNGLAAGLTGLIGIVITAWCQMRDWTKDVQRTVAQPVMLLTSVVSTAALGAVGALNEETVRLFLFGVPFAFAGTWVGLRLYGRVDETGFRRIVLVMLLASGVSLLVR